MKQLDWKSFAIGVLLTTTVMFGTGAATSSTEKWNGDQMWKITYTGTSGSPHDQHGWEPFQVHVIKSGSTRVIWRKRIKQSLNQTTPPLERSRIVVQRQQLKRLENWVRRVDFQASTMSDTETNYSDEYYEHENEKISITRADARKFGKAYEVACTTRGELFETTAHVGKLHKRIEELETKTSNTSSFAKMLLVGLVFLYLIQAGYIGN